MIRFVGYIILKITRELYMKKLKLMEFQRNDLSRITDMEGNVLLAYDMGLGKTATSLRWVYENNAFPAVVVVPASLLYNWQREFSMWVGGKKTCYICEGRTVTLDKKARAKAADLLIIGYSIISYWQSFLSELKIRTVILDEAHYISNIKAQRSKACHNITKGTKIKHKIALTGTPINNKPSDLFSIVKFIDPSIFPSQWKYNIRYCGMRRTRFGMDCTGATNQKELFNILNSTVMIRRMKADVLHELPAKRRVIVPLHIENKKQYNKAEEGFRDWIHGEGARDKMTGLSKIEYMKQAIWEGKKSAIFEWIDLFLEDTDNKLIVFGVHKVVINELMCSYGEIAVAINGEVPNKLRQEYVDRFQNDKKCRLFFGNIQAAGVGITLTAASDVAIIELPWTPTAIDQAIDRAHRKGQKNKVTSYFLLADETIDKDIYNLLARKARTIQSIIDGKDQQDFKVVDKLIAKFR